MPDPTNPPALEEMWREFANPLRSFLFNRVRNAADVEDLLQEIFLRVHEGIAGLRDAAKLEGWLYQIARNVVVDHYRQQRPSEKWTDELSAAPDVLDLADEIDLRPAVRRMINELPAKYRDALVLTEFRGQTQRDGARELGVSLTAMKSRVQRGRMLLRAMLDECCRFEFDRRGKVIDAVPRDGGCEC
jgi:RNA polymerase sigma-70 factor, ECF subfamily